MVGGGGGLSSIMADYPEILDDRKANCQRELGFGVQLSGLALTQDQMDKHMVNRGEKAEFEISRDLGAEHFQIFSRLQFASKNHRKITEIQLCYQECVYTFS